MVAAVVLAAGASSRFGTSPPKQAVFLPEVLARLRAAGSVEDVVVVLGAHEVEADARTVRCEDWERGPGASLRCGLAALGAGVEAAVVVLADGPELAPEAVERVAAAWRDGGGDVVAASYAGLRGHPVLLARAAWESVPDEGARALEPVLVPCDDLGSPGDVDRRR
jgi:CTP:molybdopterin cytidylyltransferase MocA